MTEFIHIFNFNLHFHLHFSIRIWVSLIEGSGFCSTDWLSSASKFPSCSNSQVSLLSGERRRKRAPLDNYRSQQSRKSHIKRRFWFKCCTVTRLTTVTNEGNGWAASTPLPLCCMNPPPPPPHLKPSCAPAWTRATETVTFKAALVSS